MNTSLHAAQRIQEFLTGLKDTHLLSAGALHSLEKDLRYMSKCISILSTDDVQDLNDLWREVQNLSRFFGDGYVRGDDQLRLMKLTQDFQTTLLEDIVVIRSRS